MLRVGSEAEPFQHEGVITVTGTRLYNELPVYGAKCIGVRNGVLGGYLTRDAILELIRGLQIACASEDAPSLCDQAGAILGGPDDPPENVLPILSQFIGGFDSKVTDGVPGACDPAVPDDCNAVSVCLLIEMGGVEIQGIAPAE